MVDVWKPGAVKPDPQRSMTNGKGLTVGRVNRGDLDSNRAWGVWNEAGLLVMLRRDQLLGDAAWTGNLLHVVVTEFPKTPDGAFAASVHVVERFDAFPTRATGQDAPLGAVRSTSLSIPSSIPVDGLRDLGHGLFWLHLNSGAGEYAGALVRDDGQRLRLLGPGLIDGGMGGFYADPILFREGEAAAPRWFATAYSDATLYEVDEGPAMATFGKLVLVDLTDETVSLVEVDVTFPEGWSDDDASDWLLENGGPTDLAWRDGSLAFTVAGVARTIPWPSDMRKTSVAITED